MLRQLTALTALIAAANAWMPHEGHTERLMARSLEANETEGTFVARWTPNKTPLRGVNLGSLFIYEPWLAHADWTDSSKLNCGQGNSESKSEFDCVIKNGQDDANRRFQQHWQDFIPESDFNQMADAGINTVRIPIGYWMYEAIIDKSEKFPRGGIDHLKRICEYASSRGFYIWLELHGAPGAQKAQEPFTGQYAPSAGFYNDYNYGRAVQFLEWITETVHKSTEMRNVGTIGVVNEPLTWDNQVNSLRTTYYPNAYNAIRNKERSIGVTDNNALHVGFMNTKWGSGDPKQYLPSNAFSLIFEDHRYVKYDSSVAKTHEAYIKDACTNDRSDAGQDPTVVTEWAITPPDEDTSYWTRDNNQDFFKQWFRAFVISFEKNTFGWTFWTWKYQSNDWRWSYQGALAAGIIPKDLDSIASSGACN